MKSSATPNVPQTSPSTHPSKAHKLNNTNSASNANSANNKAENKRTTPPKTRSPSKQSPSRSTPSVSSPPLINNSGPHFSSSAFLNSPDPASLPLPLFDDEMQVRRSFPITA